MGRKTAYAMVGLAATAAIVQLVGLLLPMHSVSYSTALGVASLFNLKTYSAGVAATPSQTVCWVAKKAGSPKFCDGLGQLKDLQSMSQRFCTSGIKTVFPGVCEVLIASRMAGFGLLVSFGFNVTLLATSCYLMLDYALRSRKVQHRTTATALLGGGAGVVALALLAYGIFVLHSLRTLAPPMGFAEFAVSPNSGSHVGPGYFVGWLGVALQLLALLIIRDARSSDEMDEEERQALKQQRAGEADRLAREAEAGASAQSWPAPGWGAGGAPEGQPGFHAPGFASGPAPGFGPGPAPGAPGYGPGLDSHYGMGPAPGYGPGPAPGFGPGPVPGAAGDYGAVASAAPLVDGPMGHWAPPPTAQAPVVLAPQRSVPQAEGHQGW